MIEPEKLRSVLRQWASGVTVVTTGNESVLHGMTVSSFASVSLDPSLVSVNIEQRTRTHALMTEAGAFVANILAEDQRDMANRFGGGVPDLEDRFEGVPYRLGELGCPILENVLGHLECRIHAAIPAGTHTVFVGEVMDFGISVGRQPLVYWQRKYRSISNDTN